VAAGLTFVGLEGVVMVAFSPAETPPADNRANIRATEGHRAG